MLSLIIALAVGMSWPVSVLAVDSLNTPRDYAEAGPVLPVAWFGLLLFLLLAALNDARSASDMMSLFTGTFPMENQFSTIQTVRVCIAGALGALGIAAIRGDLGLWLEQTLPEVTGRDRTLSNAKLRQYKERAWLDCAFHLYGDTVAKPDLLNAATSLDYVSTTKALRRWRLGYFASLDNRTAALRRFAEATTRTEATVFFRSLVQLGMRLGEIELGDIVHLRNIGMRLNLSRQAVADLLRETGAYESYAQSANRPEWTPEWTRSTGPEPEFRSERHSAPPPRPSGPSPFKTLGLSPGASQAEIKSAYRKLARKYHPDRFAGDDMSADEVDAINARMARINAAYDTLKA